MLELHDSCSDARAHGVGVGPAHHARQPSKKGNWRDASRLLRRLCTSSALVILLTRCGDGADDAGSPSGAHGGTETASSGTGGSSPTGGRAGAPSSDAGGSRAESGGSTATGGQGTAGETLGSSGVGQGTAGETLGSSGVGQGGDESDGLGGAGANTAGSSGAGGDAPATCDASNFTLAGIPVTDFWQPLTSTSWRNWHAVASADFNQDGYRDIVTADGGLTLFTGRGGDGYFEPGQIYGGTWHVSVVAADLNADGYPDLLSGGDVLELRLNDTFGGFDEATAYESNWGSLGPEVADLNGDGDLDVIAVNSHVIRVLLGRGDGTFDGPVDAGLGLGVGVLSESIAIADVDEDGNVDLLGATADGSRILVASGHGDGTFANPPIQYPTLLSAALNSTVTTLVARDFDGDGSTDVAVATEEVPSVNLMLNRNAGDFTDVREYELVGTPADMIAADLDGEGPPDLVVVSSRTNHVNVLLNAAAGNFAAEVYTAGASPEGVVAADLNGDGEPELVVANRETGDFSVLLNEGDGDFEAPPTYGTGDEPHAVVVEDFDADGAPDLAVTSPGSDEVTIMLQRADDSEPRRAIYDVGVRPSAIVSADMNGDGAKDVVVANSGSDSISVLSNDGNGTFADAAAYLVPGAPSALATGDLNGDGKTDLAVAGKEDAHVYVLLNRGDGVFGEARGYATGGTPNSILIAELDGDGMADVAVGTEGTPGVSILTNSGNGTSFDVEDWPLAEPAAIAAVDLDQDGRAELITANTSDALSILWSNPEGDWFAWTNHLYAEGHLNSIEVSDIDGNGNADLVVAADDGVVTVLLSNGSYLFETGARYVSGRASRSVKVKDWNSDGISDVIVVNPGSGNDHVRVMLGACTRKGADKPRVRVGLRVDIEASTACLVSDDALSDEIGSPPPNHDDLGGPSRGAPVEVLTARCKVTSTHVFADVNSYSNAFTLDTDLDSEGNGQAVLSLFARSVRDPYDSQRLGVPLVSDGPCELKAFPGSWDPSLGTGSTWASFSCPGMVAPSVTSPATPVCNVTGEVLLEHCDH